MSDPKVKVTRLVVEILDNGFIVETHGFNPYGANLESRNIRPSFSDIISDLSSAIARNAQIDAEKLAKEKAEKAKNDKSEELSFI